MGTIDREVLRACRQCYGSGECFHCSGQGLIASDLGGKTDCVSCSGAGRCTICAGRGEVVQPIDQVVPPAHKPLTFAR